MVHNILWTGGWDSTFRVLDLVLNKRASIQPYYILDYRRRSTWMELKTMEKIKTMIQTENPKAVERILDTIQINMATIPSNQRLTDYYHTLAARSHLGNQYDWLARYAEAFNIDDLELSVHVDDTVMVFIKDEVALVAHHNDYYYKLIDDPSRPELQLFSHYHFPLLDMTKTDMEQEALNSGFRHIMEQTWFCHYPTKGGMPCGLCNPCQYTREEGLGRRVPKPAARARLKLWIRDRYKSILGTFNAQ